MYWILSYAWFIHCYSNDDCSLPPSFVCDFNDGYNSDEVCVYSLVNRYIFILIYMQPWLQFQSIEKEIIEATIGESLQSSSTGHQSRSQ